MSRVSYPPALDVSDGPAYDPTDRPFVPAAAGPITLVYDSFTEASNTALASHTPDTDVLGTGWTVTGGTWTVIGADDNLSTPASAGELATFDHTGYSEIIVDVTVKTGVVLGVQNRAVDGNNRWNCFWNNTTFAIQELDGGVATTRDSIASGGSATDGETLWFADDGESLTAGRNDGASELSYSSTLHNATKKAGLVSTPSSFRLDDFYIVGNTTSPSDLP